MASPATRVGRNLFPQIINLPVLLIRDVYSGSEFFPSRVRIKDFKYVNPKKWFLSSQKYDPGCSSRIRILVFYLSRIQGSKRHRNPDLGSTTLKCYKKSQNKVKLFIKVFAKILQFIHKNVRLFLRSFRKCQKNVHKCFRPSSTYGLFFRKGNSLAEQGNEQGR
jgi:hypothetical protein